MANHRQSGPLACTDVEVQLVDLLEGSLPGPEAALVQAHVDTCASCATTLDAARRGRAWMALLKDDTESVAPPDGLVEKILARTAGDSTLTPSQEERSSLPAPWSSVSLAAVRGRSWYQPRLALVAAMAFFSVTLTLNVAGVRAADLKPGNLRHTVTRQYYSANARVSRFYANLRVVYEVESRVREFRRAAESQQQPDTQPDKAPHQKARGKDGSLLHPSSPARQDGVAHDTPAPSTDLLEARLQQAPAAPERSEA